MLRKALLPLITALFLCAFGPAVPKTVSAAAPEQNGLTSSLQTSHFQFRYNRTDQIAVEEVALSLEADFARVAGDLRVKDLPTIVVWVYPGMEDFRAAQERLGLKAESPACAGRYEIRMVSPASSDYDGRLLNQAAAHELAHCLTWHLVHYDPIPRWLLESVAQYEAKLWVDPRYLDYLVAGNFPSFADLDDAGSNKVYQVGYILLDFVVERWGLDGIRSLLQSRGNVEGAFEITAEQFRRDWKDFVFRKYLSLCSCD